MCLTNPKQQHDQSQQPHWAQDNTMSSPNLMDPNDLQVAANHLTILFGTIATVLALAAIIGGISQTYRHTFCSSHQARNDIEMQRQPARRAVHEPSTLWSFLALLRATQNQRNSLPTAPRTVLEATPPQAMDLPQPPRNVRLKPSGPRNEDRQHRQHRLLQAHAHARGPDNVQPQ